MPDPCDVKSNEGKGKKKMKKLLVGIVIAVVGVGCVTVNKNDGGNSSIKPRQVKDVIHLKYSVEKQTVSAKDQMHCLFGFIRWGSTASHAADQGEAGHSVPVLSKVKNGAYANACEAANCDQIAAARYKVTTKDYFVYQKIQAEITGYPVKVVDVEPVDVIKNPAFYTPEPVLLMGAAGGPFGALKSLIK